jgi:hypothetical protein
MKKQGYISLMRAAMPCLVVLLALSSGQLMAEPAWPGFERANSQGTAVQSKMMSAQLASQAVASTQTASPAPRDKLMVTNLSSMADGSPIFLRHNVAPNSADALQASNNLSSTRTLENTNDQRRISQNNQNQQMADGYGTSGFNYYRDGQVCGQSGCIGGTAPGLTGVIPKSVSGSWSSLQP